MKYTTSAKKDGTLKALTIVFAKYCCITCAGPITGGGFNPSVALPAVTFYSIVAEAGVPTFNKFLPSYLVGGLLGGVLGALMTKVTLKMADM